MRLPNHQLAVVHRAKVVDYLLSDAHHDGRHKAAFFKRFGFAVESWEGLAQALRQHATKHDVTKVETSRYGHRYIVEGIIHSPDTRNPLIRAVWFVETDEETPHFVTAYPLRRDLDD